MSAPSGSYYMASANPHASHPRLGGEQRADVCVIGAGMTGLTAALELAGRGYTVAVVEAAYCGYSGITTIWVHPWSVSFCSWFGIDGSP